MSVSRAIVRLWIFGSMVWIAFWTWNYTTKCLRAPNGTLFCPTASGDVLRRTDYFHATYQVIGPPIWTLVVGLLGLWAFEGFRRRL